MNAVYRLWRVQPISQRVSHSIDFKGVEIGARRNLLVDPNSGEIVRGGISHGNANGTTDGLL